MPGPINYGKPVKRPGLITAAVWEGDDDDLSLRVTFTNELGQLQNISFQTRNAGEGNFGEICLPNGMDVNDLPEDAIIASIRMAALIAGATAGSGEFMDMFIGQEGTRDLQTAIGNCKVDDCRMIDDAEFEVDVKKKGTNNPVRTILTDHSAISRYTFTPDTQLNIIPGAVEVEYGNYVHDYPDDVLTQQQKDDIVDFVMSLEPWV